MNTRLRRSIPLGFAAVFSVSFYAWGQLGGAQGIDVSYAGYLDESGVPLNDDAVDFVFSIFDAAGAVSPCDTVTVVGVDVTDGRFATVIEDIDESCVKRKDPHIEIAVNTAQAGAPTPLAGRQRVFPAVAAYTSGTGDFDSVGEIDTATLNVRGDAAVQTLSVTGDAVIGDDLTVTSITATDLFALYWGTGGQLRSDQGGSLELGNSNLNTPYIDFHGPGSASDFSVRLINIASGVLRLEGSSQVTGSSTVAGTTTSGATLNSNGSVSTYPQTLSRYTAVAPFTGSTPTRSWVSISEATLVAYCGDEDGCNITLMMLGYSAAELDEGAASRGPAHFHYAALNGSGRHAWRTAADVRGIDGDGTSTHAIVLFNTCFFTDGVYTVGSAAQSDNALGMGFMSYSGDYGAECRMTIDD
jgi:hypothetical protein